MSPLSLTCWKESTVYADNCTVIADKGFWSDDDFSLLENRAELCDPAEKGEPFCKGQSRLRHLDTKKPSL